MLSKSIAILALTTVNAKKEKLVFEDNFDFFNFENWQHEISAGGFGNNEFEVYLNNRTNSFVKDGSLYLQPTLTADRIGEENLKKGVLDLSGSTPADMCTGPKFGGCWRQADPTNNVILNPIQSARVRSVNSFNFKYGRVEIRAQLPKGDWIWPAIWFLPTYNNYGDWPASGEIDLVEGRGNAPGYPAGGSNEFGTTLHWGPDWTVDAWEKAHAIHSSKTDLSDGYHVYGLEWSEGSIKSTIDGETVLDYEMTQDQYTMGGFSNLSNPWQNANNNAAPFDQKMYLVMNVAVGGTNHYFQDNAADIPWSNWDGASASSEFWNAKDKWFPTWNYPQTHDSAMKIDYVRAYQVDDSGEEEPVVMQN